MQLDALMYTPSAMTDSGSCTIEKQRSSTISVGLHLIAWEHVWTISRGSLRYRCMPHVVAQRVKAKECHVGKRSLPGG